MCTDIFRLKGKDKSSGNICRWLKCACISNFPWILSFSIVLKINLCFNFFNILFFYVFYPVNCPKSLYRDMQHKNLINKGNKHGFSIELVLMHLAPRVNKNKTHCQNTFGSETDLLYCLPSFPWGGKKHPKLIVIL